MGMDVDNDMDIDIDNDIDFVLTLTLTLTLASTLPGRYVQVHYVHCDILTQSERPL